MSRLEKVNFPVLESTLASSGHTVWVVNEKGVITEVSGFLADQLGYGPEELRGRPIEDLVYPEDWPLVARKFAEVIRDSSGTRSVEAEFRIAGRVGGSYEVKVVATAHERENGEVEVIAFSTDITRQRIAERNLKRERARFVSAFENAPGGILLLHLDPERGGFIRQANEVACRVAGRLAGEIVDRWICEAGFVDPDPDRVEDARLKAKSMLDGESDAFEVLWEMKLPDGSDICVRGAVSALETDVPELEPEKEWRPVNAIVHVEDVTERRRVNGRLRYQAEHDSLTGLLNRRHFMSVLSDRIERVRGGHSGGAVLMVDLDGFKSVNDEHGHVAGDQVLREVARILKQGVRESDHVARLGGDEFAVMLTGTEIAGARRVAGSLIGSFEKARVDAARSDGDSHFPSVSIGVSVLDGEEADAEAALRSGDEAMYEAKRQGGGRYVANDG